MRIAVFAFFLQAAAVHSALASANELSIRTTTGGGFFQHGKAVATALGAADADGAGEEPGRFA